MALQDEILRNRAQSTINEGALAEFYATYQSAAIGARFEYRGLTYQITDILAHAGKVVCWAAWVDGQTNQPTKYYIWANYNVLENSQWI